MAEVVVYGAVGEQVMCSLLADTSEVSWSTSWGPGRPGGSWEASWTMDLRPDTTHPALTEGNRVEIWDGPGRVFAGRMTEPDRGSPWKLHAEGLPYAGAHFLSLASTSPVTFTTTPDTAIDQAITRGLPWKRPNSISAAAFAAESSGDLTRIDGLLNAYAHSAALRWGVQDDGTLFVGTDPTTPTWLLAPGLGAMGTTLETQVTHLYARYVESVTGTPPEPASYGHVVSSGDGVRREEFLDMEDLGLVSATRAQDVVNAVRSDLTLFRPISGLTVTADELMSLGGVPARLSQVRAGQMVRVLAVVDTSGNYRAGMTMDLVIGETRYTDGSGVVDLNPVGMVPRTHVEVMAKMRPEKKPLKVGTV